MSNNNNHYRQEGNNSWDGVERRARDGINREMVASVVHAILETQNPLTEEERQWVRLAIQREAQSIKLRQAVIEKTLGGLVWAALLGIGALLVSYLKSRGIDLSK